MSELNDQPYYALSEQRYALFHKLGYDDAWEGPWSRSNYTHDILEFLQSEHRPLVDSQILVTGCGDGKTTLCLADAGYQVKGVDISQTAIQIARERTLKHRTRAEHAVDDVTCLKEPDQKYDCVIDTRVHHFLTEDLHRTSHLREVFRVLRQGGIFLFTSCLTASEAIKNPMNSCPRCTLKIEDQDYEFPNLDDCHFRPATADEYKNNLIKVGFHILFEKKDESGLYLAIALKPENAQ